MSVRERERIEKVHGEVTCGVGASCTMLDPLRRCRAYAARPMICRLWGLMESMPCHYGCKPERYLTDVEAARFLARSMEIGGAPPDVGEKILQSLEVQEAALGEGGFAARVERIFKATVHRPSLADRVRLISPPTITYDRTQVKRRR